VVACFDNNHQQLVTQQDEQRALPEASLELCKLNRLIELIEVDIRHRHSEDPYKQRRGDLRDEEQPIDHEILPLRELPRWQ
jgi:hypothetical protein